VHSQFPAVHWIIWSVSYAYEEAQNSHLHRIVNLFYYSNTMKWRLMEHLLNQRIGPDNVCGLQFAVQLSVMSFPNHCHCCCHRAVGMTFPSSCKHKVLWVPYSFRSRHVSASPALVNPRIFLFCLREDASRPTWNKMEIYNEDTATMSTGEEKK